MSNNSQSHNYWANAIGFCAFCAFLIFGTRSCNESLNLAKKVEIEKEKTKQMEIQYGKK